MMETLAQSAMFATELSLESQLVEETSTACLRTNVSIDLAISLLDVSQSPRPMELHADRTISARSNASREFAL